MPYPTTHAYVACKLGKEIGPSLAAGLMFPDITSFAGTLDETKTHYLGRKFLDYLKKEDPEYSPFALGILLHDGLDYYSHEEYGGRRPGYAVSRSGELMDDVHQLSIGRLPLTKDVAHSMIELALELHVSKNHPRAASSLDRALRGLTNYDIERMAGHASEFFKGTVGGREMVDYYSIFIPENFTSLERAVNAYQKALARVVANLPGKKLKCIFPEGLVNATARRLGHVIERIAPKDELRNLTIKAMNIV
ncbi:MAG: hypothetical protein NT016_01310, partial [Candidatus Aenigmarchaeota archaeon]|nr:hypothetical protein [Candidatus Aenigmarchaeota archaeon]